MKMGHIFLTNALTKFLPLVLVGVGAVLLLVIAVLALALLRGKDRAERPASGKPMTHPVRVRQAGDVLRPVGISFFRIGVSAEAKKIDLIPNLWVSVGSGGKADICLNSEDRRLEHEHFKIRLSGDTLQVAAAAGETAVNGIPIGQLGEVPLVSGELLRAGSYEYRVIFPTEGEGEKKQ